MESYLWFAIAAAMSVAIFLIWIWRGDRQADTPNLGLEELVGELAESTPSPAGTVDAKPQA